MMSNNYYKYQKYKLKYFNLVQSGSGSKFHREINNFNQIVEGLTSLTYNGNQQLKHGILPSSLEELTFGDSFDNGDIRLDPFVFPKNIQKITFGHAFTNGDQPLKPGIFPNNLKEINFGLNFTNGDKPLEKGLFSNNLETLTFGELFNNGEQPLKPEIFPCNLKTLVFGFSFLNGFKPLEPDLFPNGLKTLIFGYSFFNGNQPLDSGLFPDSLEKLSFNAMFNNGNQSLKPGLFPGNLKEINFGSMFDNGNQPLEMNVFPNSLKKLTFNCDGNFNNGNQPLKSDVLPDHLEYLSFGKKFINGGVPFSKRIFPSSLTTLEISSDLKQMHGSNLSSDWWHQFRKPLDPQQDEFQQQLLDQSRSRYLDQFETRDDQSRSLVDQIIQSNQFEIIALVDLQEVINILKRILAFEQIGDQNRKTLVKKYLKMCNEKHDIELLPSDTTILKHKQFWEKLLPTYNQLLSLKTLISHIPDQSTEYLNIVKLFIDSFHMIDQSIINNFRVTHIFKVAVPIQTSFWNQKLKLDDTILPVWHGTKEGNLLSILRSGFTPLNTPSYQLVPSQTTAYPMFGPGIYSSDHSSKALFYSDGLRDKCSDLDSAENHGWVFLCDLNPGRVYSASIHDIRSDFGLNVDYDSLYAIPQNIGLSILQRSERVVYDSSRIVCRYLLRVECV